MALRFVHTIDCGARVTARLSEVGNRYLFSNHVRFLVEAVSVSTLERKARVMVLSVLIYKYVCLEKEAHRALREV